MHFNHASRHYTSTGVPLWLTLILLLKGDFINLLSKASSQPLYNDSFKGI